MRRTNPSEASNLHKSVNAIFLSFVPLNTAAIILSADDIFNKIYTASIFLSSTRILFYNKNDRAYARPQVLKHPFYAKFIA